jgi:LysM repeat protein
MKKFFLTLFLAGGFFLMLSHGEVLWSKRKFLDEPRVHKVQKGESLSKLAKQYYGSPKRWRELALVNRAPKPSHLQVGEEILVPSASVINELRRSRTITRVNTLIGEQEKAAAAKAPEVTIQPVQPHAPAAPTAQVETPATNSDDHRLVPKTTPETIAPPAAGSAFPWFWLALGVMIIAGAAGFIWYRRRQAEKPEGDTSAFEPRRSFDDRGRDRQAFSTASPQKENLAV